MTVKLLRLKSGEDVIADIKEMLVGEEENARVIGYFLGNPCVVNVSYPSDKIEKDKTDNKTPFQVTLFPWILLSKDKTIPIPADWVVTCVTPNDKLNDMYLEDIVNRGKETDKNSVSTEQSDSNKSD